MSKNYDVIIVGSGIAGLSFAIKVAEAGQRVAIITKKDSAESNTNYAQGGIAAVTSPTADGELHVSDTLDAGDGLCDEDAVREILRDGPESIEELARRGVEFTQLDDGRVSLGKEGGHSKRRILHVKDVTGKAIEQALLHAVATSPNIDTLEHHFAVELITNAKLRRRGSVCMCSTRRRRRLKPFLLMLCCSLREALGRCINTRPTLGSRPAMESPWPIARVSRCNTWNLSSFIPQRFTPRVGTVF